MSNEELAELIKDGDTGKLLQLWDGVRGYIAKAAYSYMLLCDGRNGVELEDLVQSGYIAMVAAVDSYEPGTAKFITWLAYYLKTAFAEATNRRTEKQRKNPLHYAASLYAPVNDAQDEPVLLLDTMSAPDAFEDVERKIFAEQLRAELEAVLSAIPAKNANVLRLHFFEDMDLSEIATSLSESIAAVSACKREALHKMRQEVKTSKGVKLRAYIEERTNYYSGTGMSRYIETLSSPVELKVIDRERLERNYKNVDDYR